MEEGDSSQCIVCLDTKHCIPLPCCTCPPSCMSCITNLANDLFENAEALDQLTEEARATKYGNCPICKKVFAKDGENLSRPVGKCYMCNHGNQQLAAVKFAHLVSQAVHLEGLCDNCWLCNAYPETYQFVYECDRCGQPQKIPHPMYRYQASPAVFGGATWYCHRGCEDFTHWKILAQYVSSVPNVDKPASWND